jgi:uncharacterized integral membrane protein
METQTEQARPGSKAREPRGERLRRQGHHTGLYAWAFGLVALLVVLIALVAANTRQVKLSWVVGTGHASLVWIILATAVLGWLLGIVTSVVFRLRTRRRRSPAERVDGGGGR